MTRHHLLLAVNAALATANTALFVWQAYTVCVFFAVLHAYVSLRSLDRLSARV